MAFDRADRALTVHSSLPQSSLSYKPLSLFRKSYYTGSGTAALIIRYDYRPACLHDRNTAVGRSKVDSNRLPHNESLCPFYIANYAH